MELPVISEREDNCRFIAYIAGALASPAGGNMRISFGGGRVSLSSCGEELRPLAEEKIAEVLCIGYKYAELASVAPAGLGAGDTEILRAAIIAADFAEDKRYVLSRLRGAREYPIDGFFTFRLKDLREKWKGVAACVPPVFTRGQLSEFMEFLLGTVRGKIFLKGNGVYDSRCRRLRRSALIGGGDAELDTLREIVLSCAGKVECLGAITAGEEDFLRRYYAGRVGFRG